MWQKRRLDAASSPNLIIFLTTFIAATRGEVTTENWKPQVIADKSFCYTFNQQFEHFNGNSELFSSEHKTNVFSVYQILKS